MQPSTGLKNYLNNMRELAVKDGKIYAQYIPIITDETSIAEFGQPILDPEHFDLMNEFVGLIRRIAFTQVKTKLFNNPLKVLEGDNIPLGYAGQEIYTNPVKGRKFNVNDFAGLLQKYETDTKQQFLTVNSDLQYPATITRAKIKDAFVSWNSLEQFITSISNALYNGAYIDEYLQTKALVSGAYASNRINIEQITAVSSEATGKAFVEKARAYFLNFQTPSSKYNAWARLGGYGEPITTWANPEDMVILIRNDVLASIDVNVLASAFNMDKTSLMGRVIGVDNFNQYDENGELLVDGSKIVAGLFDKSWFKIKSQDVQMDEFYNANNRTWQLYLNVVKMYNYSLFANAVLFATELPEVAITGLTIPGTESIAVGEKKLVKVDVEPLNGNNPAITYSSSNTDIATVKASDTNPNAFIIEGVDAGEATITVTSGDVSDEMTLTVSGE